MTQTVPNNAPLATLAKALQATLDDPDGRSLHARLRAQAQLLDAIFNWALLGRALTKARIRVALRAQEQCLMTWQILAELEAAENFYLATN